MIYNERIIGRIFAALAIVCAIAFIAVPVLAAYYVDIGVTESNGTDYDMLAINTTLDIDYLADNGYINATGLDVRVRSTGGAELPFMLCTDKVMFAAPITGDLTNSFQLTTGNTPASNFNIVTGYGGNITVADAAALELGNNFSIEIDGWLDMSQNGTLLEKSGSIKIERDTGNVTATIYKPSNIDQITSDSSEHLDGTIVRAGERINALPCSNVTQVSFRMWKSGSPTGTAYIRLRRVSDDGIIGTAGSIDVSTLTIGATWYDFTTPIYNPTQQDVRFTVEYSDGTGADYAAVRYDSGNQLDNAVRTRYTSSWTDYATDDEAIKVHFAASSVVTATISTGDKEIKLATDGTLVKLYEDDVEKSTTTLIGAIDNGNSWLISNYAYLNYYTHTTSGTLRITYEPDEILTGTTLDNESGASYDGTIAFGSNPAGISVDTSGLEFTPASYYTTTDETTAEVITPRGFNLIDIDTTKLDRNPLRLIVELIVEISDDGVTERLVWIVGSLLVVLAAALGTLVFTKGKVDIATIVATGLAIGFYIMGSLPLFVPVLCVIGLVAAEIRSKQVSY